MSKYQLPSSKGARDIAQMRKKNHTIIHRLSVCVCLFSGTAKTAEPIATIFWVCNPGTPWSKIGINIVTNLETMRTQHSGPKVSYAGKYVCSPDPSFCLVGGLNVCVVTAS